MSLPESVKRTKNFLINRQFPDRVDAAVILGSGLSGFCNTVEVIKRIPYADIPGIPETTVQGHKGELILGKYNNQHILVFSGRFHSYEGHLLQSTILPVQLASAFNVSKLLISNAAGAINYNYNVGDLMLIEDLLYVGYPVVPRQTPAFSYTYYPWIEEAHRLGAETGVALLRGTYLYTTGPPYETKAEIRAFQRIGADVVGMSTAPELFEASRLNMKTIAVSLVTNMAAGIQKKPLDHSEIAEIADSKGSVFNQLMLTYIRKL